MRAGTQKLRGWRARMVQVNLAKREAEVEADPTDPDLLARLGFTCVEAGQLERAETFLTRAANLGLDTGKLHKTLGRVRVMRWEETPVNPSHDGHQSSGGGVLITVPRLAVLLFISRGDDTLLSLAQAAYERALKHFECAMDPGLREELAGIYVRYGAFEGAAELLSGIMESFPSARNLPHVVLATAAVLKQLGLVKESASHVLFLHKHNRSQAACCMSLPSPMAS